MIGAGGTQQNLPNRILFLASVKNSQFLEGLKSILMSFQWHMQLFNAFLQFVKAKVKSLSNTWQFRQSRLQI